MFRCVQAAIGPDNENGSGFVKNPLTEPVKCLGIAREARAERQSPPATAGLDAAPDVAHCAEMTGLILVDGICRQIIR